MIKYPLLLVALVLAIAAFLLHDRGVVEVRDATVPLGPSERTATQKPELSAVDALGHESSRYEAADRIIDDGASAADAIPRSLDQRGGVELIIVTLDGSGDPVGGTTVTWDFADGRSETRLADSAGRARLPVDEQVPAKVRLEHPHFMPAAVSWGGSERFRVVRLFGCSDLTVHTLNKETGEDLDRVAVRCELASGSVDLSDQGGACETADGGIGRLRIPSGEEFRIRAHMDGYRPFFLAIEEEPKNAERFLIELEPSAVTTVRFTDLAGVPFCKSIFKGTGQDVRGGGALDDIGRIQLAPGRHLISGVLQGEEHGTYLVEIENDGLDDREVLIQLERRPTIVGALKGVSAKLSERLDAGEARLVARFLEPVKAKSIREAGWSADPVTTYLAHVREIAHADQFTIHGVGSWDRIRRISVVDVATAAEIVSSVHFDLNDGGKFAEVVLPQLISLSGDISFGGEIVPASPYFGALSSSGLGERHLDLGEIDGDRHFTIDVVPDSDYTFFLRADNIVDTPIDKPGAFVIKREGASMQFDVDLSESCVALRVLSEAGNVIPGAVILCKDDRGRTKMRGLSRQDEVMIPQLLGAEGRVVCWFGSARGEAELKNLPIGVVNTIQVSVQE